MLDEWPISWICHSPWTMATAQVSKTKCLTFIQLKLGELNPTSGIHIEFPLLIETVPLFLRLSCLW